MFLLLFADDIALTSDTIKGLQSQLNILENVCEMYKMIVNVIQTKAVVFRLGGRLRANEKLFSFLFFIGRKLEIVNGFQYVSLLLTPTLSVYRMTNDFFKKAKRILVSMLQTLNSYGQLSSACSIMPA